MKTLIGLIVLLATWPALALSGLHHPFQPHLGPQLGVPAVNYYEALPQYVSGGYNPGIRHLNPGWQFIQSWGAVPACTATPCTDQQIVPTTAGSVWVVWSLDAGGNNSTFSSVTYTASAGGGSLTLCGAPCHVRDATNGIAIDVAYLIGGPSGITQFTANWTSTPSGATLIFDEYLPPAGFTASFDTANTILNTTCTTSCPGAALTLAATDLVIQNGFLMVSRSASFRGPEALASHTRAYCPEKALA